MPLPLPVFEDPVRGTVHIGSDEWMRSIHRIHRVVSSAWFGILILSSLGLAVLVEYELHRDEVRGAPGDDLYFVWGLYGLYTLVIVLFHRRYENTSLARFICPLRTGDYLWQVALATGLVVVSELVGDDEEMNDWIRWHLVAVIYSVPASWLWFLLVSGEFKLSWCGSEMDDNLYLRRIQASGSGVIVIDRDSPTRQLNVV